MSPKKRGNIPTNVVQNCECRLSQCRCINSGKSLPATCDDTCSSKVNSNKSKLTQPELNSALALKQEIQLLEGLLLSASENLTPRSKAQIAPKVTKKMNFNPQTTVFKNLIPINVTDTPVAPLQRAQRKVEDNVAPATKAEEELCFFVEEIPPFEHVIPEPDIELDYTREQIDSYEIFKNVFN